MIDGLSLTSQYLIIIKKKKMLVQRIIPVVFFLLYSNFISSQTYDPGSGSTIWHLPGDVIVVYLPTDDGSEVAVCREPGPCEMTDCTSDEQGCKDIVGDASDGKVPPPQKSGGGSDAETTQMLTNLRSELINYRKGKTARTFYRSSAGKWSVITNSAEWKGKVLSKL